MSRLALEDWNGFNITGCEDRPTSFPGPLPSPGPSGQSTCLHSLEPGADVRQ